MKKFTGNFLSGEYRSLLHILRSVALGLVALLWAHTSTFAQCIGPDATVTFKAGELNSCFMDDDSVYSIQISAANFYNLDSINLFLDYIETDWVFDGYSILDDAFNQTSNGNTPLKVDDINTSTLNGVLNIHWTEVDARGELSRDGSYTPFLELRFRATGNPGTYTNDLTWLGSTTSTPSKIYVCGGSNPSAPYVQWTDVAYLNGYIKTTVAYPAITYTVDPAQPVCANDPVEITVTDPVGADLAYSFNGLTWTMNPVANATAGKNTVQVMDTLTGCVSILKNIVIDVPDELAWDVDITDESCDRQGEIQFNITTPSVAPYTYWVVPSSQFGSFMNEVHYGDKGWDDPAWAKYRSSTNQVLRPAGYYYIAIQDGNDCVDLASYWWYAGTNYWKYVYIDGSTVVTADIEATVDTVTCAGGQDGEITISNVAGGEVNPAIGYTIWVDGVKETTILAGASYTITGLMPGTYTIGVSDTVDCMHSEDIDIVDVAPWTFDVEYLDAPCAAATGELWISAIYDGEGDPVNIASLGSDVTFHIVGGTKVMPIDTTILAGDTLKGIPAANYSAWIQDTLNGCAAVAYSNPDKSGNTIPILDDGSIKFTVSTTDETCFEETDGSVTIDTVYRTCVSCNVGAYYEYMIADTGSYVSANLPTAWMPIDSVFSELAPNSYWVIVRDSAKTDSVCASYQKINISGADSALQMTILGVYPPTCAGGNDGYVKMYVSGGTAPYRYSVDNAPNWRPNPPFNLTEGMHTLRVMDARDCEISQEVEVDSLSPIEISATIDTIACPGEGAVVSVTLDTFTNYADPDDYVYYYDMDSLKAVAGIGTSFIPDTTELQPGKWYVVAMDPNGCLSNVVALTLDSVPELKVEFSYEDAMCYGTWTGRVNMEVTSGFADSTFMYTFANTSQALQKPDSLLNWYPFMADSTWESVEMRMGGYWFVVKGACDQYVYSEYIVIDGYDPINVDPIDSIIPVSCYGGNNGGFVVTDEVSGGAPGYGIVGATYLYTLYDADDNVVGEELQEVGAYDTLKAGTYMLYVYDNTDLTVDPTMCLPDSIAVTIPQYPKLVIDTIETYAVSCADENDGEIHVFISGGLGGVSGLDGAGTATKVDGNAYTVTVNGIADSLQDYSLKLGDLIDTVVFQTQGGDFEIVVKDANGCVAKDTVTVLAPETWSITEMMTEPSDCGEKDGVIKGIIEGGFAGVPIEVSINGTSLGMHMAGDTVTFIDTAEYLINYTVELQNDSMSVVDSGIIVANVQCDYSEKYVFEIINPFDFVATTECTKCYGESNGTITITDIIGGSGKYQFQLVDSMSTYEPTVDSLWFPNHKDKTGKIIPDYVTDSVSFNTMAAGEYKIYLRDDAGFTLAKCCRPHRVVVCSADSLELVSVDLVSGVSCVGDSTGAISVTAAGGTPPYMYSYTRTELGDDGYPYIGKPSVDSLTWYENDTITGLPVGTYIGWVLDANGCMTGCEINQQGLPVDRHRVVIMDEGAVSYDSMHVEEPMCYGGDAVIDLYGVKTGSSSSYLTIMLTGTNYLGTPVTYTFDSIPNTAAALDTVQLTGVVAPMDSTVYLLSIKNDSECESTPDTVTFGQPAVYAVTASIVGDGICVGEQQALIVIETQGGTAPFAYTIYADGVKYAGPTTNVNHVVPIGAMYTVISEDALGCEAVDTLDLPIPQEVTFTVENATCYADTLASAKVIAQGTPGRMFRAMWEEFEGDVVVASDTSDWFESEIVLDQVFTYDDTNVNDVHFEITVVDDQNCTAGIDTITFDKVDGPLQVVNVKGLDDVDCVKEVSFEVAGGTSPYVVEVDGSVVTDNIGFYETITLDLTGGEHVVTVLDANGCYKMDTITVDYSVQRDTTVEVYEGDTLYFSDVEAGLVDTMLMPGPHVFVYATDTACEGELTVTVVEVPRVAPVLDTMTPTDTIETTHPIFVLTFMDDVTLGDVPGKLTVTPLDGTTPALELDITSDMFKGDSLIVDYDWTVSGTLDKNVTYVVQVDSGVVMGQGLAWDGILDDSWTFTTGDSIPTAINPGLETLDFKVYPNPFNNFIRIDNAEKLSRVIVSNIAGQRVLDIENPTYEIRTGNLVTGVYVVTLISDGEIVKSERIIKR